MTTRTAHRAFALALLFAGAALPAFAAPPAGGINTAADRPMTVTNQRYQVPPMQGGNDAALGINEAQVERSREEAQGNYPTLDRTVGLPLGTTQDAWSKPMSNMAPGQVAPGVIRFNWSPDFVMPIRIREYMTTMLVLPAWEQTAEVIIGESQYIQSAIVRPNLVAVRTKGAGLDTTIDIVGKSGNIYTFYVRAETFNTKSLTDVNVFVQAPQPTKDETSPWFTGSSVGRPALYPGLGVQASPAAAPIGMQQAQADGAPALQLPPPDKRIFNMRMYEVRPGDRVIAPDTVYTDGVWTYFDYGSRGLTADRPVVYRLVDGVETIVNTRTAGPEGEVLVAEAVGEFVLRNGQKTVCVKLVPPSAK